MKTLGGAKQRPSHIIHQVESHLQVCDIPSSF